MPRHSRDNQLSLADFSWLNLANYALLNSASISQWAQIAHDRVELRRFVALGAEHGKGTQEFQYAEQLVEKVKATPLQPLGFSKRRIQRHQSEQPHISLLTEDRATLLQQLCEESRCCAQNTRGIIDITLRQGPWGGLWQRYAHLSIDLNASDIQLEKDFRTWLKKWRISEKLKKNNQLKGNALGKKTAGWARHLLIPFVDMEAFANLHQKFIPRNVFQELLGFHRPYKKWEPLSDTQLDDLRKDAKIIFTGPGVDILLNSIISDE
ncbi:hypothetical protein PIGHUM_04594 [Pigmentiphaga humi]|uniref:Uncharacterized protein n=1 Tax=Pigmentiphaga humi TaxID=2478468 RepID=A0A3P4B8A0_9BURK|nr:DUF6387 family protein [Pigmentiphaga humi]VCU72494.1 hypothetical protein PIGHUM_04594 [Pigmentiphaga humi]